MLGYIENKLLNLTQFNLIFLLTFCHFHSMFFLMIFSLNFLLATFKILIF